MRDVAMFRGAFTTLDFGTILIGDLRSGRRKDDTAWILQIIRGTLIVLMIFTAALSISSKNRA